MRIEVRIDRVIVDEALLPAGDGPELRRALGDELAALVRARPAEHRQAYRDRLDGGTVDTAPGGAGDLGRQVARAVHRALDSRGGESRW